MKQANLKLPAKLFACGVFKSKTKQTPGVILIAKTKDGQEYPWKGWLSSAAKENTIKKLIELGFTGSRVTDLGTQDFLQCFPNPPILDIEIEDNGYHSEKTGQWVSIMEVKWLNLYGQAPKFGDQPIPKERVLQEFQGMDFGAEIMQLRGQHGNAQNGGVTPPVNQAGGYQQQANQGQFTADDIPF